MEEPKDIEGQHPVDRPQLGAPLEIPQRPAGPEPLVTSVQVIPREHWLEAQLIPLPPFQGAELMFGVDGYHDPVLKDLNPEAFKQLVFVHQIAPDEVGEERLERLYVFRLRALNRSERRHGPHIKR